MPTNPTSALDQLRGAVHPTALGQYIDRERLAQSVGAVVHTKLAGGQWLTVSAVDDVDTGLDALASATVSFEADPSDINFMVSVQIGDQAGAPAAGHIRIKSWKTDGVDPTPVPATIFGRKVNWIAIAV